MKGKIVMKVETPGMYRYHVVVYDKNSVNIVARLTLEYPKSQFKSEKEAFNQLRKDIIKRIKAIRQSKQPVKNEWEINIPEEELNT